MTVRDKFIAISDLARNSGAVVNRLAEGDTEEIFVMRNSEPVAVLMTPGAYDRLHLLEEHLAHLEDALLVREAEQVDDGGDVDFDGLNRELDR